MALRYILGILGGILIIALVAGVFLRHMTPPPILQGQSLLPTERVTIGSVPLTVEIASTTAERDAGLSDRSSLLPEHGMLFVFDTPGDYGFWMKEMLFPLDIIFINNAKQVVMIYSGLSPDTYPEAFFPSSPARYVLEVPAGFAAANNIADGSTIVLP